MITSSKHEIRGTIVVRSRDMELRHSDVALTIRRVKNDSRLSTGERAVITQGHIDHGPRSSQGSRSLDRIGLKKE